MSYTSFAADDTPLKSRANAVLSLMSYTVVPDVTASDLNIGADTKEKTRFQLLSLAAVQRLVKNFLSISKVHSVTADMIPNLLFLMAMKAAKFRLNGIA